LILMAKAFWYISIASSNLPWLYNTPAMLL